MASIKRQKKMNRRRTTRVGVISAISVLSIVGAAASVVVSPSSTNDGTTNAAAAAVHLRGNTNGANEKDENDASQMVEPERELKQDDTKKSSLMSSINAAIQQHQILLPSNPHPHSIPPGVVASSSSSRPLPEGAIPLTSEVASQISSSQIVNSHEMTTPLTMNLGAYNGGHSQPQPQQHPQQQAPQQQQPLPPYHPNLTTHTCTTNPQTVPEYYLQNVQYYFNHSPQKCCTMHFVGVNREHCLKMILVETISNSISGGGGMKLMNDQKMAEEENGQPTLNNGPPIINGMQPLYGPPAPPKGGGGGLVIGPNGPGVIVSSSGGGAKLPLPMPPNKKPPMFHDDSWSSSGLGPPPANWHGPPPHDMPPPPGWQGGPPKAPWDVPPPPSWGNEPDWYIGGGGKSSKAKQWDAPPSWWTGSGKSGKPPSDWMPSIEHGNADTSWGNEPDWHSQYYENGKSGKKSYDGGAWWSDAGKADDDNWWNESEDEVWYPPGGPKKSDSKDSWHEGGPPTSWGWGWGSSKSAKHGKFSKSKSAKHSGWWTGPPNWNDDGKQSDDDTGINSFNYCGISFANANVDCSTPCPSGVDSDCPPGETCFADATGCPANNEGEPLQLKAGLGGYIQYNKKSSGKKTIRCGGGWYGPPKDDHYDEEDEDDTDMYKPTSQEGGNTDISQGSYRRSLQMNPLYDSPPHPPLHMNLPPPPNMNLPPPPPHYDMNLPPPPPHDMYTQSKPELYSTSAKSEKMNSDKASDEFWDSPPPNWHPEWGIPPPDWSPEWSGKSGKALDDKWDHPPPGWSPEWDSKSGKGSNEWGPPPPGWFSKSKKSAKKSWSGDWWISEKPKDWESFPKLHPEEEVKPKDWQGPIIKTEDKWGPPPSWFYSKASKSTKHSKSKASKSWGWGGSWWGVPCTEGSWDESYPSFDGSWPSRSWDGPSHPKPPHSGGGWSGSWPPVGHSSEEPTPQVPEIPSSLPTKSPTKSPIVFYPLTPQPITPQEIPTYSPTGKIPTYSPTNKFPTYAPTSGDTLEPSASPVVPTIEPSYSPTEEGTEYPLDLLVWGSPLSTSQPEENGNILLPLDTKIDGIHASAGTQYSLLIHPDGRAYSTGFIPDPNSDDYHGYLGVRPDDLREGQNLWVEVERVFDPDLGGVTFPPQFKNVYAGVENYERTGIIHSIFLDGRGNAWSTGANNYGQLCLGDTLDRLIPQKIPIKNVVDVAIGGAHTLLLTKDGTIYGCGSNEMGQLGLGDNLPGTVVPLKLFLLEIPATSISAGKDHSLIMTSDRGLHVMGSNQYGQLCVNTLGQNVFTPQTFDIDEGIAASFEASRYSSYILHVDGSVNSCGRNFFGQLGDGSNEDDFLTTVQMPTGSSVVRLETGPSAYSVFFITEDESVYCSGLNSMGQCGTGDNENYNVPTLVQLLPEVMVQILSAAEDHTISLKMGGISATPTSSPTASPIALGTLSPTLPGLDFYFWGSPQAVGQPIETPDVTVPLNVGGGVVFATAGSKYSIILLTDGSALSSGFVQSIDEYQGQLGLERNLVVEGVNEFQPILSVFDPSNLDPNNSAAAIVAAPRFSQVFGGVENVPGSGTIHTILLDEDGNAWATGSNVAGQLCFEDSVDRMIPEQIPLEGQRVIDVAIGGEHTLLLLEDGSVKTCGSNASGQLSLPLTTSTVLSISAGRSHSLFRTSDGIYFSGSNEFGQNCVDTQGEPIFTATKLDVNDKVVTSLEAIEQSSYILYDDGSVQSCGRNDFGQAGDGSNDNNVILSTVQMPPSSSVVRLLGVGPASQSVFFVTDEDELIYGTGLNDRGQLGTGDEENRNIPTRVKFGQVVLIDQITVSDVHSIALGAGIGTLPPTLPPNTEVPSLSPTISGPVTPSPTRQGMKLFFMGAPDSIGQDNPDDVLIPFDSGDDVIDASGGSKYTIIVTSDGNAMSAGYINDIDTYQGHLGRDNIIQGTNDMQPISLVFDVEESAIVGAPRFDRAFSGVEHTPNSGIIHTILLDADGQAWASGSNSNGQLCLGDEVEQVKIPEKIPLEGRIVDVAIGGAHTLLLLDNGDVYGCGSNSVGELGLGTITEQVSTPTLLDVDDAISVSAGHSHSLFRTSNSGIVFTGSNEYGQLCADTSGENLYTPGSLDIPGIENAIQFEAIKESSFILYSDGSVSACGSNSAGQLGDGSNTDQLLVMVQLDSVVEMLGVGPSSESAFFITDDALVYGTGLNERGNLGVGDTDNRNIPTLVQFDQEVETQILSSAEDHTVLLGFTTGTKSPTISPTASPTDPKTDPPTIFTTPAPTVSPRDGQDLFLWGAPKTVGLDANDDVLKPLFVEDQDGIDISAGSKYSLVVLADGSALSAGLVESLDDYQGYLGLEEQDVIEGVNEFRPISQVYDSDSTSFTSPKFNRVFAGVESSDGSGIIHSVLLDNQGNAYATGSNSKGQLCLADSNNRMVPEKIPIDGTVIDVAIGSEFTLLLLADGTVYGCGSNEAGQTGLGEALTETSSPTLLEGLSSVTSISAGHSHSLFTADDGMYYTGSNSYGQLCTDTGGEDVFTPTKIEVTNTVTSFEAIKESSFMLNEDGSVNDCGRNNYGQLGDGTNDDQLFTQADLGDNIARLLGVGPSAESIFFITEDETVYGTGLNDRGQLGTDDTEDRNTPTLVQFGSQVLLVSLSAGHGHTLALGTITGDLVTTAPTSSPTTISPSSSPTEVVATTSPTSSPSSNPTVSIETASPSRSPLAELETTSPTIVLGTASPTLSNSSSSPTVLNGTSSPTVLTGTASPTVLNGTTESPTVVNGTTSPSAVVNGTTSPTSMGTGTAWPTMNPTRFDEGTGTRSPSISIGTTSPTAGNGTDIPPEGATQMYSWGSSGAIGEPSDEILTPLARGIPVADLSAGAGYSLVILEDGTAQSAGSIDSFDNYRGNLGLPLESVSEGENPFQSITSVFDAETGSDIDPPSFVLAFAGAEAGPGEIHSVLISEDGGAYVFGSNNLGQLCLGDLDDRNIPQRVPIDGVVKSAAIGGGHTLLLLEDGSVYGCGSNVAGQIGLGAEIAEINTPTLLAIDAVEKISSGLNFSLIKAADGLYIMGSNEFGNLCIDSGGQNIMTPTLIDDVAVSIVASFEAIKSSSFISFLDGSVGACGANSAGQLGDGTNEDRIRTVIDPLPDSSPVRKLGVGPSAESAFFINDLGNTYATGLNNVGQLGVGDLEDRSSLTLVIFPQGVVAPEHISAAGSHTLGRIE